MEGWKSIAGDLTRHPLKSVFPGRPQPASLALEHFLLLETPFKKLLLS
jgi:hypothetical protein